jgi:hypothetical protein
MDAKVQKISGILNKTGKILKNAGLFGLLK